MPIHPIQAAVDMLSRDSRLRHGANDAVAYLMDLLYYGEFSIFEQVSSGGAFERVNLIGSKRGDGSGQPPLWLISYINSSVDPVPAHWASTDGAPFAARARTASGLLHGLGATSGKVDAVLKILAASRFRLEELRRPIHVVALSGEESAGSGVRSLLATGPTPHGVAVIGAPTNLELWTDHPGCIALRLELNRRLRHRRMPPSRGVFEVEITGRSAHAQHPELGDDAIVRGLATLARLRETADIRILGFEAGETANRVPGRCILRVATSTDDLPDLGPGAVVRPVADGTALPFPLDGLFDAWLKARDAGIGAVTERLGVQRNAASARPRLATSTGWLRTDRNAVSGAVMLWTGPGVSTREICEQFAHAVQHALVGEDEIEVDIEVIQDRPAFAASDIDPDFLTATRYAANAAGLVPAVTGGTLTTDAALLRQAGLQTLVFGPGRGPADLYRDDEALPINHLEAAFKFYVALIQRWCVDS
ncbi:MAG: hypothetical protein CVU56_11505 [Deltaproteobacteria bacterium HGW-Deltaproteobacteria-14]|jgi:acetylornithine deacetylase/succinyl-diaminopimelate desuccinylase-like protein|nr:MAG: hypothetical protein CVU56_11505 [Deltaproteobacteria bacterium HGW-Deltaproteobacteria-14]